MTASPMSVLRCHIEHGLHNRFLKRLLYSGFVGSEEGFDFGGRFFNRGEIGGIGWQKEQVTTAFLDTLAHSCRYMHMKIIPHDNLSRI